MYTSAKWASLCHLLQTTNKFSYPWPDLDRLWRDHTLKLFCQSSIIPQFISLSPHFFEGKINVHIACGSDCQNTLKNKRLLCKRLGCYELWGLREGTGIAPRPSCRCTLANIAHSSCVWPNYTGSPVFVEHMETSACVIKSSAKSQKCTVPLVALIQACRENSRHSVISCMLSLSDDSDRCSWKASKLLPRFS